MTHAYTNQCGLIAAMMKWERGEMSPDEAGDFPTVIGTEP
jgi:hypothetical protein